MGCLLMEVLACVFCQIQKQVRLALGEMRSFVSACMRKPSAGRKKDVIWLLKGNFLLSAAYAPFNPQLLLLHCVCGFEAEQTPHVWACTVQPDAFTAAS